MITDLGKTIGEIKLTVWQNKNVNPNCYHRAEESALLPSQSLTSRSHTYVGPCVEFRQSSSPWIFYNEIMNICHEKREISFGWVEVTMSMCHIQKGKKKSENLTFLKSYLKVWEGTSIQRSKLQLDRLITSEEGVLIAGVRALYKEPLIQTSVPRL